MVELTAAHWVYAFFMVLVLITMTFRKDTPLICIVASLVLGWVVTGSFVKGVQAVFNSITVAFSELLGIIAIISIIVAMAKMLEETGLADVMFQPIQKMLVSPEIAFWVMGVVIMLVAWVIWPSPAIALVGALLLPAAIKAGLSPINAAMAISMFGYGCALTTDFIIQGAPGITAKTAGVTVDAVMWKSLPMLAVWAAIALPLSFRSVRQDIKANAGKPIEWAPFEASAEALKEREKWTAANPGFKKIAVPVIAILFALDVVGMLTLKLRGGDATALLGGTVGIIMVMVALGGYGKDGFEKLSEHTRAGFMFGIENLCPGAAHCRLLFHGLSRHGEGHLRPQWQGPPVRSRSGPGHVRPPEPGAHCRHPGRRRGHHGARRFRLLGTPPGGLPRPGPGRPHKARCRNPGGAGPVLRRGRGRRYDRPLGRDPGGGHHGHGPRGDRPAKPLARHGGVCRRHHRGDFPSVTNAKSPPFKGEL